MSCAKRLIVKAVVTLMVSLSLQADVTITQLANEGVIIDDGEGRVMIDGMVVEPYSLYGGLPPEAASQFEQAAGAFADIDIALASHRHHDHNQPRFACSFLQASAGTGFWSGSQVIGLMREKCRQFVTTSPRINELAPQYDQPEIIQSNNIKITIFPLSHGTRKYARIQNYGQLVEMGGLKLLHIGDAAMDGTDFERAGLDRTPVDVAFIPYWFFQPGPGAAVIDRYLDAPVKFAVHIPPSEMEEVKAYMGENYPQVVVLEQPMVSVRFSDVLPSAR